MTAPYGVEEVAGIVHTKSPVPVPETLEHLIGAISAAGAKVFAVIDHSGEAEAAGLSLRDTKLVVFGNPVAGTPLMQAAPISAIDLPLKVLVWEDHAGQVWMSSLSGEWLAARHHIPADLSGPLGAATSLANQVAAADD